MLLTEVPKHDSMRAKNSDIESKWGIASIWEIDSKKPQSPASEEEEEQEEYTFFIL